MSAMCKKLNRCTAWNIASNTAITELVLQWKEKMNTNESIVSQIVMNPMRKINQQRLYIGNVSAVDGNSNFDHH